MKGRRGLAGLLAALFLAIGFSPAGGEVQTAFSDGSGQELLAFPPGGGANSTSVVLPQRVEIRNATMDLEGRRGWNGTARTESDFILPRGSTAWAGNGSIMTPVLDPSGYESQNITLAPGIKRSDDLRTTTIGANTTVYHLFEFPVLEDNLVWLNLSWEGIGFTSPDIGIASTGAVLYLWDRVARNWDRLDAAGFGEVPQEVLLTANVTVNPSRYIDAGGRLAAFVHPTYPMQYYSRIDTDHVRLQTGAWQYTFPGNLTLDVGADGTTEWSRPGPLNATETFSGAQFVSALQKAVDNATGGATQVPLRFTSTSGGLLFLSNLSVGYGPQDLPPRLLKSIPLLGTEEDRPAHSILDLAQHFDDDKGAGNLTFSVVHNTGPSHVVVAVNGSFLDIIPAEQGWSGEEQSRVRATDVRGQWAESNNFTVRVSPAPVVLRLLDDPLPEAQQDVPYSFTFGVEYTGDGPLAFSTGSRLFAMDRLTGSIAFTPRNRDAGVHAFRVDVSDPGGRLDRRDFNLTVLNLDDPPSLEGIGPRTATEDVPFTLQLSASDPDLELGLDELRYTTNYSKLQVSRDGVISFTPDNADVGSRAVSVTVSDAGGLTDTEEFTLTVINVNDPPSLGALSDMTLYEDGPVSVRLNATDPDVGDRLTFYSETALFTITPDGWINFTPGQREVGDWAVNITAKDVAGASARGYLRVRVLNVNDAPSGVRILNPAEGSSFGEGKAVTLEATASDEDGDALEYSWYVDGKPLARGQTVTTRSLGPGKHSVSVRVSDGNATNASQPVHLTVNKAPAGKGFIPGFSTAGAVAAAALAIVAGVWAKRRRAHPEDLCAIGARSSSPRRPEGRSRRRGAQGRTGRPGDGSVCLIPSVAGQPFMT